MKILLRLVHVEFDFVGALISAGFEVSATVGGIEADRSENATLIHKDLISSTGTRSQFANMQSHHR